MRNSIAKSFSDLYSVTHEIDKRISPEGLGSHTITSKIFEISARMTSAFSVQGCLRLTMSI